MSLIRANLKELDILQTAANEAVVDDMLDYYQRREDHSQIRTGIKKRFGLGIRKTDDPGNKNASIETYVRDGFSIQVDSGMVEALSIGFGSKVVAALATLFTEPGQRYTLLHDTVEDVEPANDLLNKHRRFGGYDAALVEADVMSKQIGSAGLLVGFANRGLSYQVLAPSDVRAYFADTIMDDGVLRGTDKKDIEDASAVVIRLSQVDIAEWNYLAIVGRSGENPQGRHVMFRSSNLSTKIPAYGEDGAIDYEIDGAPANPLSYWANQNPDEFLPEYPIAILDGGLTKSGELMPHYTSLYEDSLEMDISGSHLLGTSSDAARGTLALERTAEAAGKPLPRTLRGQIDLQPGQSINHISHSASDSVEALTVHAKLMTEAAANYSVPDYMVVSEDHSLDASSGVALQVKTRPLTKKREMMVDVARPAVRKIFEIEKSLLGLHVAELDSSVALLLECEQQWDAGELLLPENRKEKADRIKTLMDQGIYDTIAGIREQYNLATDAEAEEIYNKMKDRAGEFPPLSAPQKKTIGLLGNNANG